MSLAQAWIAYANGGTLIVAGSNVRGNPLALSKLIRDEQIELTVATPSEYMLTATHGAEYLRHWRSWRHNCSFWLRSCLRSTDGPATGLTPAARYSYRLLWPYRVLLRHNLMISRSPVSVPVLRLLMAPSASRCPTHLCTSLVLKLVTFFLLVLPARSVSVGRVWHLAT
jgi:hypothetical protein